MVIQPKDWEDFQHYRNRRPPWIKLHRALLDDYKYHCLPLASRAIAPFLWLLASEFNEGIIDLPDEEISFRLRLPIGEIKKAVEPLISAGFFVMSHDASDVLADCKQDALPVEERRVEERREELRLGEFKNVKISIAEHEKLKQRLNGSCDAMIERLSAYLAQTGKKYKSHYATILNWSSKDQEDKTKNHQPPKNNYGQY